MILAGGIIILSGLALWWISCLPPTDTGTQEEWDAAQW